MCRVRNIAKAYLLLSLLVLGLSSVQAAPVAVNYDFLTQTALVTDPGTGVDQRGNELQFTDATTGATATVTAWADSGVGYLDQTATVVQEGFGLGSCNEGDGTLVECTTGKKAEKTYSIDNGTGYDWMLVIFSEPVDLGAFTLTPEGSQDMDLTYWAGTIGSSDAVSGLTYAELDILFGTRVTADFAKSSTSQTLTIVDEFGAPVTGNAILIGTSLTSGADRFGLSGTAVTTVPIPAGSWLMLSALGVLVTARTRKRKQDA